MSMRPHDEQVWLEMNHIPGDAGYVQPKEAGAGCACGKCEGGTDVEPMGDAGTGGGNVSDDDGDKLQAAAPIKVFQRKQCFKKGSITTEILVDNEIHALYLGRVRHIFTVFSTAERIENDAIPIQIAKTYVHAHYEEVAR